MLEDIQCWACQVFLGEIEHVETEVIAERPTIEDKLNVKCAGQLVIDGLQKFGCEALVRQRDGIHSRCPIEVPSARCVSMISSICSSV